MVHADLHNKLHAGSTSRSEDVLTSTVLGLLRYLPGALYAFLLRARAVTLNGGTLVVSEPGGFLGGLLSPSMPMQLIFWPRLGKHGEMDALAIAELEGGAPVHFIGIEAKYLSEKSDAQRDAAEGMARDQLAAYWRGLSAHQFTRPRGLPRPRKLPGYSLVYLTAQLSPPTEELEESLWALAEKHDTDAPRLGWLSWREAWAVAHEWRQSAKQPEQLIGSDLCALLESKALIPFQGLAELNVRPPPSSAGFWAEAWNFPCPPILPADTCFFLQETE